MKPMYVTSGPANGTPVVYVFLPFMTQSVRRTDGHILSAIVRHAIAPLCRHFRKVAKG